MHMATDLPEMIKPIPWGSCTKALLANVAVLTKKLSSFDLCVWHKSSTHDCIDAGRKSACHLSNTEKQRPCEGDAENAARYD